MGSPARREEGAYPERYITDEQRSRRPIFIATLRAAASWLFFRVARSSRIDLDMLVARALKNSQLTPRPRGERHAYFGDRTQGESSCSVSAGKGMKKADRIESYVKSLNIGSAHDPCYEGYFVCFNEQQYYEAHDVLEHLWLGTEGPSHQFFKGLIQLAGAFVHLQKQYRRPMHPTDRMRLRPACRLFKLAQANLEPFSPSYLDLDVGSVLELCSENIRQLEDAQFQWNPWSPAGAPVLSLRRDGR